MKPRIVSCLGDIALAVRGCFERYLSFVMPMLIQASQTVFDNADDESVEYLSSLRFSILEAYTSIITGLAEDGKVHLLLEYVDAIVVLLDLVVKDASRDENVLSAAIGVTGDLAHNLGPRIRAHLSHPCFSELIRLGHASPSTRCQENARWAAEVVRVLLTR